MTTLITGACGFIGSHLASALLARGLPVVGIDNFDLTYDPGLKERALARLSALEGFTFVRADVREGPAMARLIEEHAIRRVAHLAARGGVRPSVETPEIYAEINVGGTATLLQACGQGGVESFVYASSSSVYGTRDDGAFKESDPADRPTSPYAATKRAAELLGHAAYHCHGLPVTCLRFFTVYGPGQRPDMAIHRFTEQLESGTPLTLFGDGSARRDFTYVADIVAGFVAALEKPGGFEIYNLGGGQVITVLELIRALEEATGRTATVDHLPAHASDVPYTRADISRAREVLAWAPEVSVAEGLARFVSWYRETRAAPAP